MAEVFLSTETIVAVAVRPSVAALHHHLHTPLPHSASCLSLPSRLNTEPGWAISLYSELNRMTKIAKSQGLMHQDETSEVAKGTITLNWSLEVTPKPLGGPYPFSCM